MMDHPNIAKVLDAGTTETGRPCFVMELVRGISISLSRKRSRFSSRNAERLRAAPALKQIDTRPGCD
jgi:serine/threonine protein kinase